MANSIAYISVIIAALALVASAFGSRFAFLTMRHQRVHNMKSVLPILHVSQWVYEVKLCVKLKNCGMGVALINKFSVTDKFAIGAKDNIYSWLPQTLEAGVNYSEYWTRDDDFAVLPGEEIDLIVIPIDDTDADQCRERERLRVKLGTLIVKIEFTDVYKKGHGGKKAGTILFLQERIM